MPGWDRQKLHAVGSGSELPLVARRELLDKLDANRGKRATVVHAPAGYGKTCLLAHWAERLKTTGIEVVWLAADTSMREPAIFHGALSAALSAAQSVAQSVVLGRRDLAHAGPPSGKLLQNSGMEAFARSLVAQLEPRGEIVVILDDYENSMSSEVNDALTNLIRFAPAHTHLVIASRVEPDLGLAPERLAGTVATLGLEQLRFSDDEVRELLPKASSELIAGLSVLTEGWPFAVHLAAIHARNSPEDLNFLDAAFEASAGELGAYISDVMLRQLPAEHRNVLLDTSFLPIFDADLAEAVTGIRACWQKLGDLKRANIIHTVPESENQSYRCHPLLRTYLHRQLRSRGPRYMQRLRWQAAACLRARGDYLEAARCAQPLGNVQLSIELFLEAGGILLSIVQGPAILQQALDLLPQEAFRHPRVRAAEACALAKKGKSDVAFLVLDRIGLDGLTAEELQLARRDINMAALTAAAYSAKGVLIKDWERFTPLRIGAPQDIAAAEGFFYNARCGIDFAAGDLDDALTHGQMAVHLYRTASASNGLAHVHVHLARALVELGRLEEARDNLEAAERCFDCYPAPDLSGIALVHVMRARVDFLRGDFAAAEAKLEPALRTLQEGEHYWEALAAAYGILSALARLRDDQTRALNWLIQGLGYAQSNRIVQLEAVLKYELALLSASAEAIEHADSYGIADSKSLRLRAGAQWLERFLHARLLAALLAQEQQGDAACDMLARHAQMAAAKKLIGIQLDCLLDLAGLQESLGQRAAALETLLSAVDIGARTGLVGPLVLRCQVVVPLLPLLQNRQKRGVAADPTPFISHVLMQCRNARGRLATLFSPREQAVLALLAASKGNKEIARELDISPETVRFHLKRIYEKLGVSMGYHSRKVVRSIILDTGLV